MKCENPLPLQPSVRRIRSVLRRATEDPLWSGPCQSVLFYFMDRFTCAHCWAVALQLAEQQGSLEERGIRVVLVGQARYGRQAASLAKQLGVPFPIKLDRAHTLRQRYLGSEGPGGHSGLVLADSQGTALSQYTIDSPAQLLPLGEVLTDLAGKLPPNRAGH
jgi:hypothetical protein